MKTYAVLEAGGQQFSVSKNDLIEVNSIDHKVGHEVKLNNVLMCGEGKSIEIGKPYLKNVTVISEIIKHKRAPKVVAFKYRKRKSSRTKKGHRAALTVLRIKEIEVK